MRATYDLGMINKSHRDPNIFKGIFLAVGAASASSTGGQELTKFAMLRDKVKSLSSPLVLG